MEWLARTVELASLPVHEEEDKDFLHGDILWFGADRQVKLAHDECGEVSIPPTEVWVTFLLYMHPQIGTVT